MPGFLSKMLVEAHALTEVAVTARTQREFRLESLARLDKLVGFDVGITWGMPESVENAALVGFSWDFWRQYFTLRERLSADLEPLFRAAQAQPVVNDRRVFDARQRDRLGFYVEIIRPIGSRNFLTALMGVRGRGTSVMQLGRGGCGSLFTERHERTLRQLMPVLSLGEVIHDAGAPAKEPQWSGLTAREREVANYVALGYTNREIGVACGTSPHTVHNQLRNIFRKFDVANRAELVGVSFRCKPLR